MHSISVFAQIDPFNMRPEVLFMYVAFYAAFTIAFLFLAWLVDTRQRPIGEVFVLWGILVVILSCGYSMMGIPAAIVMTQSLAKVGFLLVLSGIAMSVLTSFITPTTTKETDRV